MIQLKPHSLAHEKNGRKSDEIDMIMSIVRNFKKGDRLYSGEWLFLGITGAFRFVFSVTNILGDCSLFSGYLEPRK